MNTTDQQTHNSHIDKIINSMTKYKWISRDVLQKHTKSQNLSARITGVRGLLKDADMNIICCKLRDDNKKFAGSYYCIVDDNLVQRTTFSKTSIPEAIKALAGVPEKKTLFNLFTSI